MGLFSKITRSVTKPFKKVLKSPIGKAALLAGIGIYGPKMFGTPNVGFKGGWGQLTGKLPPWLYSAGNPGSRVGEDFIPYSPRSGIIGNLANKWDGMSGLGKAATIGGATAITAGIAGPKLEEKVDIDVDDTVGDADYRRLAEYYEPEWEDWLLSQGYSADEAARMANERIFSSQGGRIGL